MAEGEGTVILCPHPILSCSRTKGHYLEFTSDMFKIAKKSNFFNRIAKPWQSVPRDITGTESLCLSRKSNLRNSWTWSLRVMDQEIAGEFAGYWESVVGDHPYLLMLIWIVCGLSCSISEFTLLPAYKSARGLNCESLCLCGMGGFGPWVPHGALEGPMGLLETTAQLLVYYDCTKIISLYWGVFCKLYFLWHWSVKLAQKGNW